MKGYNLFLRRAAVIFAMLFALIIICDADNALAAESDSGSVSDSISYSFDGTTGILTITGTGDMPNYTSESGSIAYWDIPWYYYSDDITTIKIGSGITSIGDFAFYSTSATKVTMADSVTVIGNYAFYYSSSITSITLSSNLNCIGDSAFYMCTSLASMTIPSSVSTIGYKALSETLYYENLSKTTIVGDGILLKYFGTSTSYTVPSTVKSIASEAFYGNTTLKKVVLSDSVTEIGHYAFYECTSLSSITISSNLAHIGLYAFYGTPYDSGLTDEFVFLGNNVLYRYNGTDSEVSIPEGTKSIAGAAFYGNIYVTRLIIPEGGYGNWIWGDNRLC